MPLPKRLKFVEWLDFEAEQEGAWQKLPPEVLHLLARERPSIAIKFGMGLLKIPDDLECKILSYHHGDPRRFRGRPAGFYETLERAPTIGQIVQILSNRLDSGHVVAFAETRVHPYSYKATMAEAYRTSPLLMRTAIRNCLSGRTLPIEPTGRNYRLPSNGTVVRFVARLALERVRRLAYGAFFEKAWEVATAKVGASSPDEVGRDLADRGNWLILPRPKRYSFLADPFPHPERGVLAEALRRSDGQGEIVHLADGDEATICEGPGHFSYPATFSTQGHWFMLPEVSEWSTPLVYRLTADRCEPAGKLDIEGEPRLVDATLHEANGRVFLFANIVDEGSTVLRLWTADGLFERFVEHPESPIRISPAGGRMAGQLLALGGKLYRLGQDCSQGYGRRIIVFEITALSLTTYEERFARTFEVDGVSGPHTLNLARGTAFFDFYRERFSPLAGVRRLQSAMSKRKALSAAR